MYESCTQPTGAAHWRAQSPNQYEEGDVKHSTGRGIWMDSGQAADVEPPEPHLTPAEYFAWTLVDQAPRMTPFCLPPPYIAPLRRPQFPVLRHQSRQQRTDTRPYLCG